MNDQPTFSISTAEQTTDQPGGESSITRTRTPNRRKVVPPGSVNLPGFGIEEVIGQGGMGVVYLARQQVLNRLVAIKMVLAGEEADSRDIIRFLAEAEVIASIRHPHVVQVFEYGEHEGLPYLVMEYCGGGTLAERLKERKQLPIAEAAELIGKLAQAVHAAHAQGIVHRDIKPGNILFDEHDEPKVTDFGLAKRQGLGTDLTRTNAVLGTPAYMAPEQAKGESKFVGPEADVWALGVILYECITGTRPFDSVDSWSILHKVLADDPVPPRVHLPGLHRDLERVCLKCLHKDPTERYRTAAELADDLEHFRLGRPVSARPISLPTRTLKWTRRNPLAAGLVALVLLMATGLMASLFVLYQSASQKADLEETLRLKAEHLAEENANLARLELDRRREADLARENSLAEAARANEVSDFLASLFEASDPLDIFGKDILPQSWEKAQQMTARDFLDQAAARFQNDLTDQPLVRARLLRTIGTSYSNLGLFTRAGPLLEESHALISQHLPEAHAERAQIEFDLGRYLLDQGDIQAAEERFRKVLAIREQIGAPESLLAGTKFHLAYALTMAGDRRAGPIFREVIAIRERLHGPHHPLTTQARVGLAAFLIDQVDANEVPEVVNQIRIDLEHLPEGQIKNIVKLMLDFQSGLMMAYTAGQAPGFLRQSLLDQAEAKLARAVTESAKVLPENHIYLLLFRWMYALHLASCGKDEAAAEQYALCLKNARTSIGLAHPRAVWFVYNYANFLARTGKLDQGIALFEEANQANLERFGPENLWRGPLLLRWITFESVHGRDEVATRLAEEIVALIHADRLPASRHNADMLAEACAEIPWRTNPKNVEVMFQALLRMVPETFGQETSQYVESLLLQGKFLGYLDRWGEAQTPIQNALELMERVPVYASQRIAGQILAGELARSRGDFAEAVTHLQTALKLQRSNSGNSSSEREGILVRLGGAFADQARYSEAIPHLQEALALARKRKAAPDVRAEWAYLLALVQQAAGQRAGYLATLEQAVQDLPDSPKPDAVAYLMLAAGLDDRSHGVIPAAFHGMFASTRSSFHYRARTLCLLRADVAEARSLTKPLRASRVPWDQCTCALIDYWTGSRSHCQEVLTKVEEATTRVSTPEQPHPFAGEHWSHRLYARVLARELQAALARTVEQAPAPRIAE